MFQLPLFTVTLSPAFSRFGPTNTYVVWYTGFTVPYRRSFLVTEEQSWVYRMGGGFHA